MINASDFCVFYYNSFYQPVKRKQSKASVVEYRPNSGTKVAFDYALQRKRGGKEIEIFNLYEEV